MYPEIENKVNELSQKVIPEYFLQSFLELPLKDRLVGLATFAHISKEKEVYDMCQYALKIVK
jgi:hypothetical protein